MRRKVKGLLLMLSLFQLHMLVSSSALPHTLPSDLKQENPESNGGGKEGHEDNGSSAFKESAHCFGNGTSNVGGSTGSGENGNSGGSRSPYTQGGSNLIPVYAAGSAKNRKKKHRGAANSNRPYHIALSFLASVAHLL